MFFFSKHSNCNALCDLYLPKCCNGVSCATKCGASCAIVQLPLVTLFCASVDVTDYSEFKDVFHKEIGTKTSFSDCIFIPNPHNEVSFAFFKRAVLVVKALMKIEIFGIKNIFLKL